MGEYIEMGDVKMLYINYTSFVESMTLSRVIIVFCVVTQDNDKYFEQIRGPRVVQRTRASRSRLLRHRKQ